MRIECHHDWRSVGRPGVFGGGRYDCLVTEMNAVEDADGQKEWTG
jgi:histidyl-tRNA synthetase